MNEPIAVQPESNLGHRRLQRLLLDRTPENKIEIEGSVGSIRVNRRACAARKDGADAVSVEGGSDGQGNVE